MKSMIETAGRRTSGFSAALTAAADVLRLDVRHAVRMHVQGAASSLSALAILALGIPSTAAPAAAGAAAW